MCAVFQMNPFLSSRDVIAQIFDLICFFFLQNHSVARQATRI